MRYSGFWDLPNLTAITPRVYANTLRRTRPVVAQFYLGDSTLTFSDGGAALADLLPAGYTIGPHLLHCEGSYGDTPGRWSATWPLTGESFDPGNASASDHGFCGTSLTYCYTEAGTYTPTLRLRGKVGASWVTAETTTLIQQEVWTVGCRGGTTGTFTLIVNGVETEAIAYNARNYQVEAAINTALGLASGVVCFAGPAHIAQRPVLVFTRMLAPSPLTISTDGAANSTGGTILVQKLQDGGTASGLVVDDVDVTWSVRYVSNSGDEGNDGLTPATAKSSYSAALTWFHSAGDKKALFLDRGSVFEQNTASTFSGWTGRRVLAYGTGNRPRVRTTAWGSGSNFGFFNPTTGGANRSSDFAIHGVRLDGDGVIGNAIYWNGATTTTTDVPYGLGAHVDLVDCEFWDFQNSAIFFSNFGWGCGRWGNSVRTSGTLPQAYHYHWGGIVNAWDAPSLNYHQGGGQTDTYDHYDYSTCYWSKASHGNTYVLSAAMSFAVNSDTKAYTSGGRDVIGLSFSANDIRGTVYGYDLGHNTGSTAEGKFTDASYRFNKIHDLRISGPTHSNPGTYGAAFFPSVARQILIVGCRAYNCGNFLQSDDALMTANVAGKPIVLDCEWYAPDIDGNVKRVQFVNVHGVASGTLHGLVSRGNKVRCDSTYGPNTRSGVMSWTPATDTARFRVDLNTYYAPNLISGGEVKPFTRYDSTSLHPEFTWDEYRAATGWDAGGSYADPGWPDPANGDFGEGGGGGGGGDPDPPPPPPAPTPRRHPRFRRHAR